MRHLISLIVLALFLSTAPRVAAADTSWGGWQSLGSGVSISVGQIGNSDTYCWRFHNDTAGTITKLEYQYSDKAGTHNVVITKKIRAGGLVKDPKLTSEGLSSMKLITVERKPGD